MIKQLLGPFRKILRIAKFLNDPGHYYSNVENLKRNGMKIGNNVQILHGTILDSSRPFLIEIGNNVTFAPRCHILTHDASMELFLKKTRIGKVKIFDNCFIGAGTIILPGVSIGPNSIVGAGSVVSRDVPANSVAVGNPVHVVSRIDEFLERHRDADQAHPHYPYPEYHGKWISPQNAMKMADELDGTHGYSVGAKQRH
ncbi:MAG: hypothetical protein KQH59_12300 [Desulfobulbaceae bacterium]|nr:hypothetical protein [Desulfobulbaceae bacterium]